MRLLFSVIGLLVVAVVLLKLASKQAQVLLPATAASRAALAASGGAMNRPQQVQQDLGRTLEQGLQQRASEPGQ